MMDVFTQLVVTIGRISPNGVEMLGTGFIVRAPDTIVTPRHVIGDSDNGLVILMPRIESFSQYQDTSDNRCMSFPVKIIESDPIHDISILKLDGPSFVGNLPTIGGFDDIEVGQSVDIYGYPHCTEGRRVLTYQRAEIGSKVLLESNGIKSKYAVINIQSRPGQSGSMIFCPRTQKIVGMLNGAYVPDNARSSIAGINPHELNQTTQCISAQYIEDML